MCYVRLSLRSRLVKQKKHTFFTLVLILSISLSINVTSDEVDCVVLISHSLVVEGCLTCHRRTTGSSQIWKRLKKKRVEKGAQTHKAADQPEHIDADEQLLHCSWCEAPPLMPPQWWEELRDGKAALVHCRDRFNTNHWVWLRKLGSNKRHDVLWLNTWLEEISLLQMACTLANI